jgi:hypothetical protein
MKNAHWFSVVVAMAAVVLLSRGCKDIGGIVDPAKVVNIKPCSSDEPVEDTTRLYIKALYYEPDQYIDTLELYPSQIFARFYPWVRDTMLIHQTIERYGLRVIHWLTTIEMQYYAELCVPAGKRAEYYFTPYGKTGCSNFGADSLVEYSFGVFNEGFRFLTGNIDFKFKDSTPQTTIDSLFEAKGLRLIGTNPDFPSGVFHTTLVTPRSTKNIVDLTMELQFLPFIIAMGVDVLVGGNPPRCD